MYRSRSIGILFAVAMLVASTAAPAAAKKGGHPGPPSGTGLEVTVEPSSGFMSANSVGDQILFDITVTNTSVGDLAGSVEFEGFELGTFALGRNDSWIAQYTYTVDEPDFDLTTPLSPNSVTVGTVTATATTDEVTDSADAVMTAYPVPTCAQTGGGAFTFATTDDYAVCSFTAAPDTDWTLTTTVLKPPRGKRGSPAATVRDGVPGNWCMVGDLVVIGDTVVQDLYFPNTDTFDNIVCEDGGAGGDTIPVRNPDTFYLATNKGNTVCATPDGGPICNP